jgi:hypothetical protein
MHRAQSLAEERATGKLGEIVRGKTKAREAGAMQRDILMFEANGGR